MTRKRKQVTMLVTVSGPAGMTAAQARRNVRDLINHQCHTGLVIYDGKGNLTDIDEYNFRARRIR